MCGSIPRVSCLENADELHEILCLDCWVGWVAGVGIGVRVGLSGRCWVGVEWMVGGAACWCE